MGYGYGFSYTRQKKIRERERRKHKRHYPMQRFLRVSAQVRIESTDNVIQGRALLHDLTPGGISLFIDTPLVRGEKISIVIEQPKHVYVKGEITWCGICPLDSKILHVENFKYRIGVKFHFETEQEAQAIGDFCASMAVTLERA
jgi:hypothetical protein